MNCLEIELKIQQLKTLLKESEDIDEMVEYDEELNNLYIQFEEQKQKEILEALKQQTH